MKILFLALILIAALSGTALGDGTEWKWHEEYQNARMTMYGFEPSYSSA